MVADTRQKVRHLVTPMAAVHQAEYKASVASIERGEGGLVEPKVYTVELGIAKTLDLMTVFRYISLLVYNVIKGSRSIGNAGVVVAPQNIKITRRVTRKVISVV